MLGVYHMQKKKIKNKIKLSSQDIKFNGGHIK